VFRQRFVGITGEREVAEAMERVLKELQAAGAALVDVAIPDYDEKYRVAAGSAPDRWPQRGRRISPAAPRRTSTCSPSRTSSRPARWPRRTAPARRRPRSGPTGAELDEATRGFYARREAFRQLFVDLMEREKLDAMLYPANQARPHTHEGGAERYGTEPGTCQESAPRAAAGDRAGRLHRRTLPRWRLLPRPHVGRPEAPGSRARI